MKHTILYLMSAMFKELRFDNISERALCDFPLLFTDPVVLIKLF